MNRVVAVVGMCGSGKSVATDLFVANNWEKVYFGGVTLDTLKERDMEITPDNERMIREELREKYGQAAYAVKLLPKIKELLLAGNVVADGLYSWSEYKYLQENLEGALTILCIISDRKSRYGRLENRPVRPLSAGEATGRDIAEIENLEKGGPIAIADHYIVNNGTKEDLERQVMEYICSLD